MGIVVYIVMIAVACFLGGYAIGEYRANIKEIREIKEIRRDK